MMIRISNSLIAKMNIYVLCWITLLQLLSNFLSYQTQARFTDYMGWSQIVHLFDSFHLQRKAQVSSQAIIKKALADDGLKSCQDEFNDILLLICCVDLYSLSQ